MKRNDTKKLFNFILVIFVASSLFLFVGIFIRGQKDKSTLEARKLTRYEQISISSFFNGKYQFTSKK